MSEDVQLESAITTGVLQHARRRSANRQPAKDERSRMEGEVGSVVIAFRPDQFDGLDASMLLAR
jgi:hypothetical protein